MYRQRLLILLTFVLLLVGLASMNVTTAAPLSVNALTRTLTPLTPTITPTSTSDVPRPLVTLLEAGEAMVVRGTMYRFVLYDTGQVIFVRYNDDSEYELATVMLDDDEVNELLDTLDIGDDFYALDERYEASDWTDQMSSELCVFDEDGGEDCVWVYGDLRPYCAGCDLGEIAEEARANTPDVFLNMYDTLIDFDHSDAQTWTPETYSILIWEFESRRSAELTDEFEALFDPTGAWTEARYTIYVDSEQVDAFWELVSGESTVEIDGRTWAFSVRMAFPHEGG